jgi:hypothetical protein
MAERPKISAPVPLDTTKFKFHLPRNSELNRVHTPYDNHSPFQYEKDAVETHEYIREADSGRRGFHPIKFLIICFNSSCTLSKVGSSALPDRR